MVQSCILQKRWHRCGLPDLSDEEQHVGPATYFRRLGTNNANYYNGRYTDPINYLTPVGAFVLSPGLFGTYDIGGDVWEWNETVISSFVARFRSAGRTTTPTT